jgi:hypothetical protein
MHFDWKTATSQGYIIRILQHFATKLRNITNFVMLFQAVMKFLSRAQAYLDQNFTHEGKVYSYSTEFHIGAFKIISTIKNNWN